MEGEPHKFDYLWTFRQFRAFLEDLGRLQKRISNVWIGLAFVVLVFPVSFVAALIITPFVAVELIFRAIFK